MSKSSPKRSRDDTGDWKHLLSVGGLLGAIAIVLLAGALLQDDGEPAPPAERALDVEPPPPREAPAETAPAPAIERDRLATRVMEDLDRLPRSGWTRQLAAVCDPDNARKWLDAHGDRPELYLLPVTIGERACVRVCWGHWSDDAAAERARLPSGVRARAESDGRVVETAGVVR